MNRGMFTGIKQNGHIMPLVDCPFFAYRGGKARIRKYIIPYLSPILHNTYVEPFAGRANVFFVMRAINTAKEYVLNDISTIPFLKAVQGYKGTPFPTVTTKKELEKLQKEDPIVYLLLEPLLCWAGGTYKGGSGFTGSRGHHLDLYKQNVIKARSLLDGKVTLVEKDALEIIEKFSENPNALLYLDPPYLEANVKIYSQNDFDFSGMVSLLLKCKCKWVLSEYENLKYTKVFGEPKAKIFNIPVNANPKQKTAGRAVEVLYSNIEIKPGLLDWSMSEKPLPISISIFRKLNGRCSFIDFEKEAPPYWTLKTKRAQFYRIADLPYTYFDGITIRKVEKEGA